MRVYLGVCLCFLAVATFSHAQSELATVTPSDSINGGAFGFATAMSGNTAVVTQRNGRNANSEVTGAAFVYLRTGSSWTEQAKLNGSAALVSGDFGRSAAISGDTIVIGAAGPTAGGQVGKVFVFTRTGTIWSEQAVLTSPTAAVSDFFGSGVAIDADTIVVGSNGQRQVFVYTRSGTSWTLQTTLTDVDDSTGYGVSVGIDGPTIVVGASGYRNGAVGQGGAFVYTLMGGVWSQFGAVLLAPDGAQSHLFGTQVAISGDTIIAGAPSYFPVGGSLISPQGSAYVFQRTAGVFAFQAQLNANDAAAGDRFGSAVAVRGDQVVVGAPFDNAVSPAGNNVRGSAHLFERNGSTWGASIRFVPASQVNGERFGRGVAYEGSTVVIGADQSNGAATIGPGKAVLFNVKTGIFSNGFE